VSTLTLIVLLSILLRIIALVWSVALVIRHRDWRMGTLSLMLVFGVLRQAPTAITVLTSGPQHPDPTHGLMGEIPALLVSVVALYFVYLIDSIITSQKRENLRLREAEERLRHNEARLRVMLEQLPAVVWTTDLDLVFTSSLGAGLKSLGLEPDQVVGKTLYEYFGTKDRDFPALKAHLQALEGELTALEQNWGGQSFHVMVEPLRGSDDSVIGTLGVGLDVTELAASERALRMSEERYRDFLAQTSEGIWRLELAKTLSVELPEEEQIEHFYRYGSLAECSDAFARMYGLAAASVLVGARLDEILPRSDPRNRDHLRAFVRRAYSLADAESTETDDKGRIRHFVNTLTGIVEKGQVLRLWGTKRDVTKHEEAERALRASEERYRELFEASQDTIFISTPEGRIIDINPVGLELLGFERKEDLLHIDIARDLYQDPEDRHRILQVLTDQGYCRDFELRLKRKDGKLLRVLETTTAVKDTAGRIIALRGMLRDVTQQRQLEEQLLRAQRMEAVGRLAGGVAHDFNNLLTVINGRSDLLRSLLEPDSPLEPEIDEIKKAGKRAASLTRQLLILSRRQVSSPQAVNLNQIITNVENLLRRSIGELIELVTKLSPDLANVISDASQVEQVLLNLALNARDAMPRGGTLTFETENVTVTRGSSLSSLGLQVGPHVVLRVEDTGVGIDPAIRGQIFEPFVTTKAPAEGTGLGLSTVYGIVQQSNGQIRVDSEPGRGACFEIFLPAVKEAVVETPDSEPETESPRGTETILLVEDEAAVRSLLRRFLDSQGYRVVEAADGEMALAEAESREGEVDLLLTDLVMPGMGGFELARRMEKRWPALKILYMSGYSEDAVGMIDNEPLMSSTNFLQKPFSTDLLARRIRSVFDPNQCR